MTMKTTTSGKGSLRVLRSAVMAAALLVSGDALLATSVEAQARGGRDDVRAERMRQGPAARAGAQMGRQGAAMRGGQMRDGQMRGAMMRGAAVRGAMAARAGQAMRARGPEMLLRMRDRLELTDDQVTSLEQLRDRSRRSGDDLQDARIQLQRDVRDGNLTVEDARTRAEELRSGSREHATSVAEQARATLTEEQTARLEGMRDGMRMGARMERRDGMRPQAPAAPRAPRRAPRPRGN